MVLMAVLCIGIAVAVLPAASSQVSGSKDAAETAAEPSESPSPSEGPTESPSASEEPTEPEPTEQGPLIEEPSQKSRQQSESSQLKPQSQSAPVKVPHPNWVVSVRPVFNNPFVKSQRRKIDDKIVKAINNTRYGSEIRFASYSFNNIRVAKALIRAHRERKVHVQVLTHNHAYPKAQRMLKREVGGNRSKTSWIRQCGQGCRTGKGGTMHTKFYLFKHTGAKKNVIMFGSHNNHYNAWRWQWNDLMTTRGNYKFYLYFRSLFNVMKRDYHRYLPSYTFCKKDNRHNCVEDQDKYFTRVLPKPDHKKVVRDDTWRLLNRVDCKYSGHRTKLRLAMHSMRGRRGISLGKKIRAKYAEGCNFKVVSGLLGWHVLKEMGRPTSRGRIPIRSTGFDYNKDGHIERYTHQKFLTVIGRLGGNDVKMTLTGSQNWSTHSLYSDEITVQVHYATGTNDYNRAWNRMFYSGRYTRNAYTTTYYDW